MKKFIGLTNNQLKILALIFMTVDHIGVRLFPKYQVLRIIGRLAFPIFAYMIAEGCRYTRNKKKYILTMAAFAAVCQLVYFFAMNSLYQCILVTFTLSIALIFAFDHMASKRSARSSAIAFLVFITVTFICVGLPRLVKGFTVDYGFLGVLLPLFIYTGRNDIEKLFLCAFGLALISIDAYYTQWFSLLALPFLAAYNGRRGKCNLKYLFYIYYPLHLVIIYAISKII